MLDNKMVRIGDFAEILHGHAFQSKNFTEEPTQNILLTPKNIDIGGGFNNRRFTFYRGNVPSGYTLNPGELVVAMTDLSHDGAILGCSARIPHIDSKIILQNQRIGRVLLRSDEIHPCFLYWLLRSPDYRNYIIGSATGTTVRHTSPKRILDYRFFLPPMDEQVAIAAQLDSVESTILNLHKNNETLETGIFNLYHYLFSGKKFKTVPLNTFGKIVTGKTPSKKIGDYFGGDIPFIKIPDLRYREHITSTADSLSVKGAASQPTKELPAGSVCVSCIATIGLVGLTTEKCHTNQQIHAIIPCNLKHRYYLFCTLKSMKTLLEAMGQGGSVSPHISRKQFLEIPVSKPPVRLMKRFSESVHPAFELILENSRAVQTLEQMRDLMLPHLMAGRPVGNRVKEV